jgi:hypothetical protein
MVSSFAALPPPNTIIDMSSRLDPQVRLLPMGIRHRTKFNQVQIQEILRLSKTSLSRAQIAERIENPYETKEGLDRAIVNLLFANGRRIPPRYLIDSDVRIAKRMAAEGYSLSMIAYKMYQRREELVSAWAARHAIILLFVSKGWIVPRDNYDDRRRLKRFEKEFDPAVQKELDELEELVTQLEKISE